MKEIIIEENSYLKKGNNYGVLELLNYTVIGCPYRDIYTLFETVTHLCGTLHYFKYRIEILYFFGTLHKA